MIYLIICLFVILLVFVEAIEVSKLSSAFYGFIICSVMLFFAALRDKVGTDWDAYYEFYTQKTESVEIGYSILNNFFRNSGIHYNLFLFFLNFVSLALFYFSLKKHAVFFVISLLLFYSELFLYFNFSGIRQGIAVSICIYGVRFCIDRKFWKFLFFVLLAFTFHITALIFIIAYFIPFRKFNKKEFFLITGIFSMLSIIIFAVFNLLSGDLATKAKFYLELQEQDINIKGLFFIGIVKRSIILFMIFVFGKEIFKVKTSIYFFNVYLIGFGMYLSTYLISPDIGVRLSSYFLIFDIVLAGNLIMFNQNLTTRLLIVTLFSIEAIYKVYTYMNIETYVYHNIILN